MKRKPLCALAPHHARLFQFPQVKGTGLETVTQIARTGYGTWRLLTVTQLQDRTVGDKTKLLINAIAFRVIAVGVKHDPRAIDRPQMVDD